MCVNMNEPIDWSKLSTETVLDSLKSAPRVAGPWQDRNTIGGLKLCKGMWKRSNEYPGPSWLSVVTVQMIEDAGFYWSLDTMCGMHGNEATKEAAMVAADASLVEIGWRLMGRLEE